MALELPPAGLVAGREETFVYRIADARTGDPVTDIEPYLGAWGHSVIMSEDTSSLVHAHPVELLPENNRIAGGGPALTFKALMPKPGTYRVWTQLKRALHDDGTEELTDDDVVAWFLDPNIVMPNPSGVTNMEPLLVNTIGSLCLRPEAVTRIANFFLAGDYVRTFTDLATMEAANEAARRAVNGILFARGSAAPRCPVWPFEEPAFLEPFKRRDAARFARGLPHFLDG